MIVPPLFSVFSLFASPLSAKAGCVGQGENKHLSLLGRVRAFTTRVDDESQKTSRKRVLEPSVSLAKTYKDRPSSQNPGIPTFNLQSFPQLLKQGDAYCGHSSRAPHSAAVSPPPRSRQQKWHRQAWPSQTVSRSRVANSHRPPSHKHLSRRPSSSASLGYPRPSHAVCVRPSTKPHSCQAHQLLRRQLRPSAR